MVLYQKTFGRALNGTSSQSGDGCAPLPTGPLQGHYHDLHIRINEAALARDAPPTAVSAGCPTPRIRPGDISLLVTMVIPLRVMWPPAQALP